MISSSSTKPTLDSPRWLWGLLTAGEALPAGTLYGAQGRIRLAELALGSCLAGRLERLRGLSVLVAARNPLAAALALIELDGVARRMVLCPPDLRPQHLPGVVRDAGASALVGDSEVTNTGNSIPADELPRSDSSAGIQLRVAAKPALSSEAVVRRRSENTEWVLLTSGTSGAPKLVLHTFESLTSAFLGRRPDRDVIWGTFYDIRRYGGLQILLRALHGGSCVLADPDEPVEAYLARAGAIGVTHLSGTPSHWRRALMSGVATRVQPRYVRLSGEIADQGILDALRAAYPQAQIEHAFASTEAGVAFTVGDGLAGLPVGLLDAPAALAELKLEAGTLRIRGPGNAACYLGEAPRPLKEPDGFVDTGDRLERRGERYHFAGRSGGVINIGGLKVHPEEVEAVLNAHPAVRMSLVRARRNPITGAVVAAEVVPAAPTGSAGGQSSAEALTRALLEHCRRMLPAHKVPAVIRIVPALPVAASGKLRRSDA